MKLKKLSKNAGLFGAGRIFGGPESGTAPALGKNGGSSSDSLKNTNLLVQEV